MENLSITSGMVAAGMTALEAHDPKHDQTSLVCDVFKAMLADARGVCQCPDCKDGITHTSDCAAHNAPALAAGPCTCGADYGG